MDEFLADLLLNLVFVEAAVVQHLHEEGQVRGGLHQDVYLVPGALVGFGHELADDVLVSRAYVQVVLAFDAADDQLVQLLRVLVALPHVAELHQLLVAQRELLLFQRYPVHRHSLLFYENAQCRINT